MIKTTYGFEAVARLDVTTQTRRTEPRLRERQMLSDPTVSDQRAEGVIFSGTWYMRAATCVLQTAGRSRARLESTPVQCTNSACTLSLRCSLQVDVLLLEILKGAAAHAARPRVASHAARPAGVVRRAGGSQHPGWAFHPVADG